MKLTNIAIHNFRRLENVEIDVEDKETIFVGPNNSGKTSATAIFRCFLGGRDFKVHDLSVARIADFNQFVETGNAADLPEIASTSGLPSTRTRSPSAEFSRYCPHFPISSGWAFAFPTRSTMRRS